MSLETKNITLGYTNTVILSQLNVTIPKGEITMLIGGNGCGKSTLLKSLARLLKPISGQILLNNQELIRMNTKDIAKELSILTQAPSAPVELTIFNLVKQGRYPYQNFLKQWSDEDEEKVMYALKTTGLYEIKDKKLSQLSGGQLQRAWIALTLAQDTDIILLDEPTNHLDLKYKIEVLDLLKRLNEEEGRTIVVVMHDVNLASRYGDHIVAIKDGSVFKEGRPSDIVNNHLINEVYNMQCSVVSCPVFNTPWVIAY